MSIHQATQTCRQNIDEPARSRLTFEGTVLHPGNVDVAILAARDCVDIAVEAVLEAPTAAPAPASRTPLATSLSVPSPPTAMTRERPSSTASRARVVQ